MKILFAAALLGSAAGTAAAQTAPDAPAPNSASAAQTGTPTSSSPDAPICTDRPTKSNFACTVPEGDVQIESDLFNWSRSSAPGVRTDTYLVTNPTVKYGVGPSTDLEANIIPYEEIRTHTGGQTTSIDGVGDLYLRVKQRLTDPTGKAQFSLIPYVKAPTAKLGIGNREWEGGLIAPFNYSLPRNITLTIVPEVDVLANAADPGGRHAQLVGLVNLGFALTPRLTLYTELWTAQNLDPSGTVRQYSADTALAYLVTRTVQVDVGGNFGLNRTTPDAQLYLGVSTRF